MRRCRRATFPSSGCRPSKRISPAGALRPRRCLWCRRYLRPIRPRPTCPAAPGRASFKSCSSRASWLPRNGDEGFGFDTLELKTVLGLPCPTREYPLLITPGFAVHYLDGPAAVALPPQLYDAYLEFRWLGHVTPRLGYDVAVTPAVDSDFRQHSSQALRVTGHGIAAWTCSPTLTLVLGADYLDRTDVPLLPVAGLVWKPNDNAKFELVFPQPKISHRFYWNGIVNQDIEDWIYIGGELGGGTWAIQRGDGANDVFSYRDLRVFLGVERKAFGRLKPPLRGRLRLRPQAPVGPGGDRFRAARHPHGPARLGLLNRRGCESVPLALPALPCFHSRHEGIPRGPMHWQSQCHPTRGDGCCPCLEKVDSEQGELYAQSNLPLLLVLLCLPGPELRRPDDVVARAAAGFAAPRNHQLRRHEVGAGAGGAVHDGQRRVRRRYC